MPGQQPFGPEPTNDPPFPQHAPPQYGAPYGGQPPTYPPGAPQQFAQPGPGQQPYGQPQYGQLPSVQPPAPPGGKRRLPLILALVGVLVVALVAGLVVYLMRDGAATADGTGDGDTGDGGSGATSPANKEDMALAFFTAVQNADAKKAMSFAADPIPDTSMLTDEVLKKSYEIAPITDVRVLRSTDDTVTLTMDVAGRSEQIQYDVVQRDGEWKMVQAVRTFEVLEFDLNGVTPILNGQKPKDPTRLTLFPGTYRFETGSPYLTWAQPEQTFLLGIPTNDPILGLQMSDDVMTVAMQAFDDALDRCLASTKLAPKNCPFSASLKDGDALVAKSVRWTVEGDPEWVPLSKAPTFKAALHAKVRLHYRYKHHGKTRTLDDTQSVYTQDVTADLRHKKVKVTFG